MYTVYTKMKKLLILLLILLPWLPVGLFLLYYKKSKFDNQLSKLLRFWFKVCWNVDFKHKINPDYQYIIVCNHQSMLDVPLLLAAGARCKWMAKDELFEIPILGNILERYGCIKVNLKSSRNKSAILEAAEYLKMGESLLVFPEGKRNDPNKSIPVDVFKSGAFCLSLSEKVIVLNVVISGTGDALPIGKLIPSDAEIKYAVCGELDPYHYSDYKKLKKDSRWEIIKNLNELCR